MNVDFPEMTATPTDRSDPPLASRRAITVAGISLMLSACANVSSPVVQNAAKVVRNEIFGYPDMELKRSAVNKLPYAVMLARVGNGPQALVVLSSVLGDRLTWVSADRASLVTLGGRVVRTSGFPENLKNTVVGGEDPTNGLLHLITTGTTFTRVVDIDREHQIGLIVDSEFTILGRETINIVEIDFETILVRERNRARSVNWDFDNFYWVDAEDGYVWRSVQHIARTFPPLEYSVLKPFG